MKLRTKGHAGQDSVYRNYSNSKSLRERGESQAPGKGGMESHRSVGSRFLLGDENPPTGVLSERIKATNGEF